MRALAFAARSLLRQPGRASVGILGIAAVGALLFDMLLLSRGLVVSFRDLLDSVGFDVRVLSTDAAPMGGPRLPAASAVARDLAALPEVDEAVPVRMVDGEVSFDAESQGGGNAASPRRRRITFALMGISAGRRRPWTITAGRDPQAGQILVNRRLANELQAAPGTVINVRATCAFDRAALPPRPLTISGIGDFPFDDAAQLTAVTRLDGLAPLCGGELDEADMLLVASREPHGADGAVTAIRRVRPELHPATNEEIVARMQQTGFSYFRQISAVLSTITLLFGFLLITVLLTVSVNQRFAEIAAMRALGFSRSRVAADVLCQSALLVGTGGTLAIPAGMALSMWLDVILKNMPGIPATLHFFVFESRTLWLHAALLAATAVLAALYPMRLVATLPIAATLRNEVVS
jgi:ABC-type lipoprotein release transport system permease subunit